MFEWGFISGDERQCFGFLYSGGLSTSLPSDRAPAFLPRFGNGFSRAGCSMDSGFVGASASDARRVVYVTRAMSRSGNQRHLNA